MTLLRGAGDGLPTGRWLREVIWPREARLTADDVGWGMALGAAELLANGVTTSVEMYFAGDVVGEAAAAAGLRCVVTAPLLESGGIGLLGPFDDQLAEARASVERWAGHPLVSIGLGPHSGTTLGDDALARVGELAGAHDLLVHLHLAEQRDEGDAVTARTGRTVPAHLDQLGLMGPRTLAAHGVWLTDADIALLADRGAAVVHCPVSNARHASGIAPVAALRSAGVRVGLGTDGPVSHPRLDPWDDLREAQRQARLRDLTADRLPAAEALRLATTGSADALGRSDLGRLTPGACADLVEVGLDGPGVGPLLEPDDLVTHVVGSVGGDAVRRVWVQGRLVVDAGRCVTVDLPAARAEVAVRARRLAGGSS
jgi:5-methylthioadenosine/S-adenosylhomocysteine deaminase